jgi:membrane protease YdiL (CAAX protease family)
MTLRISNTKTRHLVEAVAVLLGMWIFASFIHGRPAQRIVALVSLGVVAVIISVSISDLQLLRRYLGLSVFSNKLLVYSLLGSGLGILLALLCRSISGVRVLPPTLTIIAVIAPLIGFTEELLFRGFLQEKLSGINIYAAILLSSFGHTIYKYLVLRSLPLNIGIDFISLVVLTFIAGIIYGILRLLSKSIMPACLAHGIFDLLVYGGLSTWPVWVWN